MPAVVEAEFLLVGEPEALHEPGVRALELRQPLAREREPPAEIAPTDLGKTLGACGSRRTLICFSAPVNQPKPPFVVVKRRDYFDVGVKLERPRARVS